MDPSAPADGEPCSAASARCRGQCVPAGNGGQGICASLINPAQNTTCPDDPDHIRPIIARPDQLAVCAFKTCTMD